MLRDYYYPTLANRDSPTVWAETGAPDAWQAAKAQLVQLQLEPRQDYLSQEADAKIRAQFPIKLSREIIYR